MDKLNQGLEKRQDYPLKSTHDKYDVVSIDSEQLDLYFIRSYVSKIKPEEITVSSLESQMNSQLWEDGEENSPAKILSEYKRLSNDISSLFQIHPEWTKRIERIQKADYSHAILIYKNIIIDGLHRTVHALMDGKSTIPAHILTNLPEEAFYKGEVD